MMVKVFRFPNGYKADNYPLLYSHPNFFTISVLAKSARLYPDVTMKEKVATLDSK